MQIFKQTRSLCLLVAVISLIAAAPASAGSTASGVKIANIELNKSYGTGGMVFIKLTTNPLGKPACSNHYWDYTLVLATPFDEKLYAILVAALTTGGTVEVTGMGDCSDNSGMERIRSVGLAAQ